MDLKAILENNLENKPKEEKEEITETLKPLKFAPSGGYFQIYILENKKNFNMFIAGLDDYLDISLENFDPKDKFMDGSTKKEYFEYMIQDILNEIYQTVRDNVLY